MSEVSSTPDLPVREDVPGSITQLKIVPPVVTGDADDPRLAWIDTIAPEVASDATLYVKTAKPIIQGLSDGELHRFQDEVRPSNTVELDDLLLFNRLQECAPDATVFRTKGAAGISPSRLRELYELDAEMKKRAKERTMAKLYSFCVDEREALNIMKYFSGWQAVDNGHTIVLTPEQIEDKVARNDFDGLPSNIARSLKLLKKQREAYETFLEQEKERKMAAVVREKVDKIV